MQKKKILVVEDEPTLREQISEILLFEGFDVISAENGVIGVTLSIKETPDLILSDVMMPVMDGVEFLKEIRKNELTKLTPFIFMTALAERENMRMGMELGADDYLTKPFTQVDLLKAVEARVQKLDAITEEKEQALDTLRTTIITRLPHELRSPLAGIIGFGTLLKDMAEGLSAEDIADIGNEILNSGNRLLRLIENYIVFVQLQLSDIKRDKLDGSKIEPIIEEAALTIAQKYERQSLLKIAVDHAHSLQVTEDFLNKIIFELCDNAFRFSPPNTEVVIIGKDEGTKYTISVSDKGRGFTKEQIARIGAYMQFDREKLEQQGSGLGLVIAKKMTELSEGTFKIETVPNEGTAVILEFKKH
ncbi:MAG: response regulator [Bacteroidales bacterium]